MEGGVGRVLYNAEPDKYYLSQVIKVNINSEKSCC